VLLVSSGGLLIQDLALQSSYEQLQAYKHALQAQVDNYLRKIQQADENFASARAMVEMRSPLDEDETRRFITLDDAAAKALVGQITAGGDGTDSDVWSDIYLMTRWVIDHVSYSYDTYTPEISGSLESGLTVSWYDNFWRFPNETIRDGHGDCEDSAVLLTTMIRCYYKYYVGVMSPVYAMSVTSPSLGHMAVVIPVAGGRIVILDPSAGSIVNWSQAQSTADAMATYFSNWSSQVSFDRVQFVFNDRTYKSFSTLSDFISWIGG
jgi:hypothetical protein